MTNSPEISVVVCTRDRPEDLADLLLTIFDQSHLPLEVIIIDDSPIYSAKQIVDSLRSKFRSVGCELRYGKGSAEGLPAARNLGVKMSKGDAILFLDDDTSLGRNVVSTLVSFLEDKPIALGVQPNIVSSSKKMHNNGLAKKLENAVYKVLMLSYCDKNKLTVRRSGASVFPNDLSRVISAQRLFGCCCYRREVFSELRFDTNLKRWGFMEDLDFSYRVNKIRPQSLYVYPQARIIHKASKKGTLPTRRRVYMTTIYWFYVFFKDQFESSVLNLIAFVWALIGNVASVVAGLLTKKKPKSEWWTFFYLLDSYVFAFKHLRSIRRGNLEFFNRTLPT